MTVRELLARITANLSERDLDRQVYFMDWFNGDPTEVVNVVIRGDVVEIDLEDIDLVTYVRRSMADERKPS